LIASTLGKAARVARAKRAALRPPSHRRRLPRLRRSLRSLKSHPSTGAAPKRGSGSMRPRWILTAVDHRAEIWRTYPVQRIVVEARDEHGARKQVAAAAPRHTAPNPWLDPALTSCERCPDQS
jgi:hypothetical protein